MPQDYQYNIVGRPQTESRKGVFCPQLVVSVILRIVVQIAPLACIPVAELCRKHGMSDATFYNWRAKYGGMDVSMMNRMKELEAENQRLKKMYAEERLKAEIRKEALEGKHALSKHGLSIRLTCEIFSISETCYRYQPKLSGDNAHIADWLLRLTTANRTWGFLQLYLQRYLDVQVRM